MTERKSAGESWDNVPAKPVDKPKNVVDALARIRAELPGIGKDQKADPAMGGYNFRGIEDITSVLGPLLGKYGVVFTPHVQRYVTREIIINNRPWTEVEMEVKYCIFGPGGLEDQLVVGPLVGVARDNSDKWANKAESQAYKYTLNQVFCIGDKASDGDSQSVEADALPAPNAEAEEAMHDLTLMIEEHDDKDVLKAELLRRFGPSAHMDLDAIYDAQKFVAGFPDTAT